MKLFVEEGLRGRGGRKYIEVVNYVLGYELLQFCHIVSHFSILDLLYFKFYYTICRGGELSLSRETRSPAPEDEKKAKKPTQPPKRRQKQYSFLEQDFATDNVYNRDYYGGRYKGRGCQKRTLFVSFRSVYFNPLSGATLSKM